MKLLLQKMGETSVPQRTWELANNVQPTEAIYVYDANEQRAIRVAKPWEKDPHYFKVCYKACHLLVKILFE